MKNVTKKEIKKVTARKTTHGEVYDKSRTMEKLLDAVGVVVQNEGFKALNYTRVATKAGVDRKLIYEYFGSLDNLLTAYLRRNDFWNISQGQMENSLPQDVNLDTAFALIKSQYDFFEQSAMMQQIVLEELSGPSEVLRQIGRNREMVGGKLFKLTDKHFKGSNINFRAVSGILICAIYYMVLYNKATAAPICEIAIDKPKGKKEMLRTMHQILEWAYAGAKK